MKRLCLFAVLFFLIVGLSAVSWAEGRLPLQGSLGYGARAYAVFPKGDSFLGQDLDFDNEIGGEVNVTYRFLKYLALEGAVGYTKIDVENEALGVKWATIEAIPISATLQFRWVSRKPDELKWIVPYVCIGGGYSILNIEERSEFRRARAPATVELEVDDALFFHLGGGLDIFLTKNLALNLEARYSWAKMDIDETQSVGGTSQTLGERINLNAASIGAGFKFYF